VDHAAGPVERPGEGALDRRFDGDDIAHDMEPLELAVDVGSHRGQRDDRVTQVLAAEARRAGGVEHAVVVIPRVGPRPVVASGMLAQAGATVWLAQLGPHTGYAAGVLGPIILAGLGVGMVISTSASTGTFGVARQDAGVASATVTVGQQLGASIGTSLLNTIFAAAVTAYLAANLPSARLIGRQALTALALAHGYDTAFW